MVDTEQRCLWLKGCSHWRDETLTTPTAAWTPVECLRSCSLRTRERAWVLHSERPKMWTLLLSWWVTLSKLPNIEEHHSPNLKNGNENLCIAALLWGLRVYARVCVCVCVCQGGVSVRGVMLLCWHVEEAQWMVIVKILVIINNTSGEWKRPW